MNKTEEAPRLWMHKADKELRWWWHYGRNCFHLQLSKPQFHMGFGVQSDGERTLNGDFCGIYWHLDSWEFGKRLPKCANSFRLYWYEWGLWLSFWGNDWESCNKDPWWRKMYHFDLPDFFLGKAEYSKRDVEVFENVVIPMPERTFLATVTFEECVWKRPRWFPTVRQYSEIKIDSDPPKFPGKGENSWDQGDDAIYQMSVKGHSLPKAIGGYVERVMEYRLRRSGLRSLTR